MLAITSGRERKREGRRENDGKEGVENYRKEGEKRIEGRARKD